MSVKLEVSNEVINANVIMLCNPLAVKKAVVIPENPTNGDVIKALFPDYKTEIEYERVIFFKNDESWITCHPEWWNSPYKAERSGSR